MVWLGITPYAAIVDSNISWILLSVIAISAGNILQFYSPGKSMYFLLFAWDAAISGIWLLVTRFILSSVMTDTIYLSFLEKSLPVRFFVAFLVTGWFFMISWLVNSFAEQQKNEKRKAEAVKLEKDAELYKLRKQFQPHFLFNSLNSISSLVSKQPEQARAMIQQLADFMRGSLKNEEELRVSLKEELRYLRLYLDIEKVRFGERLDTTIENDDAAEEYRIPALILQPVVENAIKFGIYDTTEHVSIKISAVNNNNLLIVKVENPYDSSTAFTRQGTGFGLNSISRRLYLLYGRTDLLETSANGNHFITTIKIPQL